MVSVAEANLKVQKTVVNMDRFDRIVNGGVDERVAVDDGSVRSLRGIEEYGKAGPTGNTGPANSTYASAANVTAQANKTNQSAIVADPSRGGTFAYRAGNFSALLAADPLHGVSIPAAGDPTGTTGVWQRIGIDCINVRHFGAKGNFDLGAGATDDTDAFKHAVEFAEYFGGAKVLVPIGAYKITEAIDLPGTVSIGGFGQFSRIIANVCNGINVLASDVIGPRRIDNLWIQGNGADTFAGINIAIDFPARATGVVIENCYISFFGTGILSKGLWHSIIHGNVINQVYRGIILYDRNVKVDVSTNHITYGGLISGTGPSIAFQVGDDTVGLRPEDVQVHHNIGVGFAIGVYWRQGLFGGVVHNDLDYCTLACIDGVTMDGGTTISDNWGQVDNPDNDVYGIRAQPLGTSPGIDNVAIHNNRMRATDVKTAAGEFHAYGIWIGNNQANLSIEGNSIQGAFQADSINGMRRGNLANNKSVAQLFLFDTDSVPLHGNTWLGGITLSGNVNTDIGKNFGLHTSEILGSIAVPAGALSATATFLSMNMPDLPLGGYAIAVLATDRGNLTHGGIAVVPTRTGITVYCEKAIPNLPSTIDFQLRIY